MPIINIYQVPNKNDFIKLGKAFAHFGLNFYEGLELDSLLSFISRHDSDEPICLFFDGNKGEEAKNLCQKNGYKNIEFKKLNRIQILFFIYSIINPHIKKLSFDYDGDSSNSITINFASFGYKYGVQSDFDYVIDVRSLHNPYWVESLRQFNGVDEPIKKYLNSFKHTKKTLKGLIKFINELIASSAITGKKTYNIGIGCTGGQHRSVFVADYLHNEFSKNYKTSIVHINCPKLKDSYE